MNNTDNNFDKNNKILLSSGLSNIEDRNVLYAVLDDKVLNLDSMYSEGKLLDIWIRNIGTGYGQKYVFFGIGNGMYVKKLLSESDDATKVLIYEPSKEILDVAYDEFGIKDIVSDKRVKFVLDSGDVNTNFFDLFGEFLEYSDINNIKKFIYPNYDLLYGERCKEFFEKLHEVISSMKSNRSVYERFGEYFSINCLHNTKYIESSRSVYSFKQKMPKDIPAVLVACGPSLTKNIEQLKDIKNKAFIIAADSAVKVLLNHDITPHMFASIDADKSPLHFDDERIRKIPLLGDFSTCAGAIDGHEEPYFITKTENPHLVNFFNNNNIRIPKLATGGSVANTAMSFILDMGFKQVILIGQDLAYTNEKSHADGATRSTWNLDLDKNSVMVEGIDGNMVKSSTEFVHYRNWFERTIADFSDVEFINATEGGARIHGAREMTFANAIEECCFVECDIEKVISDTEYLLNEKNKVLFRDYIEKIPSDIDRLTGILKDGIRTYGEMTEMVIQGTFMSAKFKELFSLTNSITKQIESIDAMYYVECLVQKEMTELINTTLRQNANEIEELLFELDSQKKRMELFLVGCERVKEHL